MMPRRRWTPEEDAILRKHYAQLGPTAVLAKLREAGHTDRFLGGAASRAYKLGLQNPSRHCSRRVIDAPVPEYAGASWRRRLVELAESNPSLSEYLRRKAEILGEA